MFNSFARQIQTSKLSHAKQQDRGYKWVLTFLDL